jgi:hypothetical protein
VPDHPLIVPSDNLESSCNQVQPHVLHLPSPCLLTLPHPFELLLEGMDSGLEILISLLLGAVSLHFGNQPPQPHTLHLPQQLVVEVGRAREELVQPRLEGLHRRRVFVIFHFFVRIGVGKYFFDKGGVVAGSITGQPCHHSSGEELDPISLLPNVFLKRKHEVWGSFGVVLKIPFWSGMVGSLVLSDLHFELLQLLISFLVLASVLLQLPPVKGFSAFDGFDKPPSHLHDRLRVVGGEGEEVQC